MQRIIGRLPFVLVLALATLPPPSEAARITLLDRQTTFQHLTVVEDTERRERYLYSDDERFIQGVMSLRRPDALEPAYLRSALLGLLVIADKPRAMLFVGLGTGAMPRYLSHRYPRTRLDAVEIDPEVPPLARRFFSLPKTRNLHVTVTEGREFIRTTARRYDLVLMDAYFGTEIPRHLATLEFMHELRQVLRPGGVVVANLPAPALAPDFWSVFATYRAGFAHVRVFATESAANYILLASEAAIDVDAAVTQGRIRWLRDRHRIEVDLEALASRAPVWGASPKPAPVLHDAQLR